MDQILQGIILSDHPDLVKQKFIDKVIDGGSNEHLTDDQVSAILYLTTDLILNGDTKLKVKAGWDVFKAWAKWNLASLERFANNQFILSLLDDKPRNYWLAPKLLHECMCLLERTSSYEKVARIVEVKAISYIRQNPDLKCLRNFIGFLTKYKDCIPKGKFTSTFCISLIHAMSVSTPPDSEDSVTVYIYDVNILAELLHHIWSHTDPNTMLMSLEVLFEILSSVVEDLEPSICLASLVQFLPDSKIDAVVSKALSDPNVADVRLTVLLERLIRWISWPTARNIDLWVVAFLKGLASSHKYTVLINVTVSNIDQVFERIKYSAVCEPAIIVASHMLLSFQHSPEPFHKILPLIPDVLFALERNKASKSRWVLVSLIELFHCLINLHAGFPDLYDPILEFIKDYPVPSYETIRQRLSQNKWTTQRSDGYTYVANVTQKSETGKTGLFNLGNTCYMNSVLQTLYMCDKFRRTILAQPSSPSQTIVSKIQYVFAALSLSQRPAQSPLSFLHESRPSWFTHGHQQDCSEYLKHVLDRMHEQEITDAKKTLGKADHGKSLKHRGAGETTKSAAESSAYSTIVDEIFGGRLAMTTECLNCHHRSQRMEAFTDIPLAFPDAHGQSQKSLAGGDDTKIASGERHSETQTRTDGLQLYDLINHFRRSEKLSGDNKYHCDNCDSLQDGERSIQFSKAPQYLILTLLRFSYDSLSQCRTKIFREIQYPRTLLLQVDDTSDAPRSPIRPVDRNIETYALCSVIVHSGTSSDCGHYYCYARHSQMVNVNDAYNIISKDSRVDDDVDFLQDKWYLFNDSRVSHADYKSFNSVTQRFSKDTAYVLVYEKIDLKLLDVYKEVDPISQDPPLRKDLRDAVIKDNSLYIQEQENAARARESRKRAASSSSLSWYNRRDEDDDQGPPGSCGGGGGLGGLDTSGSRFVC